MATQEVSWAQVAGYTEERDLMRAREARRLEWTKPTATQLPLFRGPDCEPGQLDLFSDMELANGSARGRE